MPRFRAPRRSLMVRLVGSFLILSVLMVTAVGTTALLTIAILVVLDHHR